MGEALRVKLIPAEQAAELARPLPGCVDMSHGPWYSYAALNHADEVRGCWSLDDPCWEACHDGHTIQCNRWWCPDPEASYLLAAALVALVESIPHWHRLIVPNLPTYLAEQLVAARWLRTGKVIIQVKGQVPGLETRDLRLITWEWWVRHQKA